MPPKRRHLQSLSKTPLWRGPYEEGLSQSLLQKFYLCRERFRLLVVEGLREDEGFKHSMEYGNMIHAALEHPESLKAACKAIEKHTTKLKQEHPTEIDQIAKWGYLAKKQIAVYLKFWKRQDEKRKPLLHETTFKHPYKLPSGRTVLMRGKWDSVYQTGRSVVRLQENKAKGLIDEEGLLKTLHEDLQTMYYFIPLFQQVVDGKIGLVSKTPSTKLTGVLYNVIRRPLADKYSPRPKKSEGFSDTNLDFLNRVISLVEAEPERYFYRWNITVTQADVVRFQQQILNPILEQLCDWWDYLVAGDPFDPWAIRSMSHGTYPVNCLHHRRPFGIYDGMSDGRRGDFFNYISSGGTSKHGLKRVETVFPELQEE